MGADSCDGAGDACNACTAADGCDGAGAASTGAGVDVIGGGGGGSDDAIDRAVPGRRASAGAGGGTNATGCGGVPANAFTNASSASRVCAGDRTDCAACARERAPPAALVCTIDCGRAIGAEAGAQLAAGGA